jgi:hypothetical protein
MKKVIFMPILMFFLAFLIQMYPSKASLDVGDSKIRITPPEVRINGVSPFLTPDGKPQFSISTNKGSCSVKTDCSFRGGDSFVDFDRDNFYRFGFNGALRRPEDCSLYISCPFVLQNDGCMFEDENYNETWTCDEDFVYKDMYLEFDDLIEENPKMTFNVTQIDKTGTVYRIDFFNIQRFDPVVKSGGTITIPTGESFTCLSLNSSVGDTAYWDCQSDYYCEQNAKLIIEGEFNLTDHCVVSQNMGDRVGTTSIGANASVIVKSGGYLECSYSATYNSTASNKESTIWIKDGSSTLLRDCFFDELGTSTNTKRDGITIQTPGAYVFNNTFYDGKWVFMINEPTCSFIACNGDANIENNTFEGQSVKAMQIFGANYTNVSGNTIKGFNNTGIRIGSLTQVQADNIDEHACHLLVSDNVINGVSATQIHGIYQSNGYFNVFRSNTFSDIERNTNKASFGLFVYGNDTNVSHTHCEHLDGTGVGEVNGCVALGGSRNYVNGTSADWVGGALCSQASGVTLFACRHCISEDNIDLDLDTGYSCPGYAYILDSNSHNNTISEAGLELMNNDNVVGVKVSGSDNFFENIKFRSDDYGAFAIWLDEADGNTFKNIDCEIDNNPYSCLNIVGASDNHIIDSILDYHNSFYIPKYYQ